MIVEKYKRGRKGKKEAKIGGGAISRLGERARAVNQDMRPSILLGDRRGKKDGMEEKGDKRATSRRLGRADVAATPRRRKRRKGLDECWL